MRTKHYLLILTLLPLGLCAQYTGYMGKKVVFQANVSPWIPVVQNLSESNYENKNGRLVEKGLMFGLDARAGFNIYPKRNVGFGIDVGQSWFSFDPPQYGYANDGYYDSFDGEAELIDVRALQVVPHIEISNKQGLLPIGIAHSIGVGINSYKLVKKDYLIEDNGSINEETLQDNYYNWKYDSFKGFSIIYGLNMRLPLSERLLLTYNLTYSINIVSQNGLIGGHSGGYYVDPADMRAALRQTVLYNFFRMGIGLAVTL